MFTSSWISDRLLLSPRMNRYFRWASWATVALFLAGMFVWYCYYLSLTGRTNPLEYLGVRIFLAAIGASGALGGLLLWDGMWGYWKRYDNSPKAIKRLWFVVMAVFVFFGCVAYYHLVYRTQVERRRLE